MPPTTLLIRWTIGPVRDPGFHCLRVSIAAARRIYGARANYLVCHNQLPPARVRWLRGLGVPLHAQDPCSGPAWPPPHRDSPHKPEPTSPACGAWKLCPPRLRPDGHELILDNDLVLHREPPAVAAFRIAGDITLLAEDRGRAYGRYDDRIRPGLIANTGLIGLPPGLDFAARLAAAYEGPWGSYFDEQGLVTAALQDTNLRIVGRDQVGLAANRLAPGRCGYHFIGLNRRDDEHPAWRAYVRRRRLAAPPRPFR